MSNKKFIRLNINDNYLSLGNLFRVIKEEANNSKIMWQPELFSIIFNTEDFADSTVNNYCTGLRTINSKYKNYFKEVKNSYEKDEKVLVQTIGKIIELLENKKIDLDKIDIKQINNNIKIKNICNRLYSISKNDTDVSIKLSSKLYRDLEENNLYSFIVKVLFYIVKR